MVGANEVSQGAVRIRVCAICNKLQEHCVGHQRIMSGMVRERILRTEDEVRDWKLETLNERLEKTERRRQRSIETDFIQVKWSNIAKNGMWIDPPRRGGIHGGGVTR